MSKSDTGRELVQADIDDLVGNDANFYAVDEDKLEDLKNSIALSGIMDPPTVTRTEDGKYRLLGGNRLESADVRILAASNTDLQALVDAGGFRADLHYRLNVMELAVPPLRVRGDDIALLARHFLGEAAQRYGMKRLDLHPDTVQWLASQPWPGNIRELQNRIQREFLMCSGASILIRPTAPMTDRRQKPDRRQSHTDPLNFNEAKQLTLQAFERNHLLRLMRESAGNVSRAARLAGKERRALGKLLKKYCIEPGYFRTPSNA